MNVAPGVAATPEVLADLARVAARLGTGDVCLLGIQHNGHTPVFVLDRKPCEVEGAVCRRRPLMHGVERTWAAPFHGVQLQWNEVVPYGDLLH